MRLLLSLSILLLTSVSAFALPQTVQLAGTLQSRSGFRSEVRVALKLKKENSSKAKYTGRADLGQVLANNERISLTMNLVKGKSEGVVDLHDGHIAFDAKAVYTLEAGQQLQLKYAEYRRDHMSPPCHPMDTWCRPGSDLPRLVDQGVLHLTVVDSQ